MNSSKWLILFLLVLLGASGSPAMATPKLVNVTSEDKAILRQKLPKIFSNNYDYSDLDEAIRILALTNRYESIEVIKMRSGKLAIEATPLRKIEIIEFTGNRNFDEDTLRKVSGLKDMEKFQRQLVIGGGEAIKEYYERKGYFNSSIDVLFVETESGNMKVTFQIKEGKPCKIQDIKIHTKNDRLQNILLKRIDKFKDKNLTDKSIDKIQSEVEDYFDGKRFLQARLVQKKIEYNAERTKAVLEYELKNPFRFEVIITGNQYLSTSGVLRTLNLSEFDRTSVDPGNRMARTIKKKYLDMGFPHVKVSLEEELFPEKFIKRLRLNIDEGPRVKIKEINVVGRLSRPESYYADFIHNNSSDLIDSNYYNREDLELGYSNLQTELRNQGYVRAKIQAARVEYSDDRSQVTVSVTLDEGPLTTIKGITFEGLTAFSKDKVMSVLNLNINEPLRLNELEDGITRLEQFYHDHGYLEMQVENKEKDLVTYDNLGAKAFLVFDLYEGPKIKVGSIVVEGNDFTKDYVVLRLLTFSKGEILTPDKIDESVSRLNRLGIFTRAEVKTLEVGTNVSERTIIVLVTERNPGLFKIGAGVSSKGTDDLRVGGFTGISYSNINGTGRAISARVDADVNVSLENKYPENKITVGYLEPFLFASKFRGRINLTREERATIPAGQPTDSSGKEFLKIEETNRLDLLLERDIGRHTKFTWKLWSLDSTRVFQDPKSSNQVVTDTSNQQVVTVGPIVEVDTTDNIFMPTKGWNTRLSIDYSSPGIGSSEQVEFYKVEGSYSHHKRLLDSSQFVWANSLGGGYLEYLGESKGVPRKYTFFLGGPTTIRGFNPRDENSRIPRAKDFTDYDQKEKALVATDSTYFLYKSELRFPIYGILAGVLFFDAGKVSIFDEDFAPTEASRRYMDAIHRSVGFGFRFITPVGPLNLEYAWEVTPEIPEEERNQSFHFTIGTF